MAVMGALAGMAGTVVTARNGYQPAPLTPGLRTASICVSPSPISSANAFLNSGSKLLMADSAAAKSKRKAKPAVVEASVAPSPEEVAVEEATGIKFLKKLTPPKSSKQLTFVGAGVREKQIAFIKVKVYAVGFYVDPDVTTHLQAWKGKAGVEVAQDEDFYAAFIKAPVTKSILITLARDIDGAQLWAALDEALVPRLKAAGAGRDGDTAVAAFARVFQGRPFKQGTTFLLNWSQPAMLEVSISGSGSGIPTPDVSTIESAPLVTALFDIYLGPMAISPSAKTALAIQAAVLKLI